MRVWMMICFMLLCRVGDAATPLCVVPYLPTEMSGGSESSSAPWDRATALTNFILADSGNLASEQTVLQFYCDRDSLHIRGRMSEFALDPASNMADSFKAAVTQRDGNVWADDSVELRFETAGQQSSTSVYVAVNALGTLLDMRKSDGVWDKSWSGNIKVVAHKSDGYWTFEMTLPLADLGIAAPFDGQSLRFNAVRFEQRLGEKSSWTRLPDGNHMNAAHMGQLVLSKSSPAVRILPMPSHMSNGIPVRLAGANHQRLTWTSELLRGSIVLARATGRWNETGGGEIQTLLIPKLDSAGRCDLRFDIAMDGKTLYRSTEYPYSIDAEKLHFNVVTDGAPFQLWVNGQSVAGGEAGKIDANVSLRPGANVVAIRLPAGRPVACAIAAPGGARFTTSDAWKVHADAKGAADVATDDSDWPSARISPGRQLLDGVPSITSDGQGMVVYRKTILYQATQLYPTMPDGLWRLSEGGTYLLHWNGGGLPDWQLDHPLKQYVLTLDLPVPLQFVGASGQASPATAATEAGIAADEKAVEYHWSDAGPVTREGRLYHRYRIRRAAPVSLTAARESWLDRTRRRRRGLWIAVKAPAASIDRTSPAPIVYWSSAMGGSYAEIPRRLNYQVLPALQGTAPGNLTISLRTHAGLLNDSTILQQYYGTIRAAGVTEIFDECQSDIPRKLGLKQTEHFNFGTSNRVGFGSSYVMIDELIKRFPESRAVAFNGKKMPTPCLSYLARHEKVWPLIEEQVAAIARRNPSMTGLFWDYEFPPFPEGLSAYPMFSPFAIRTFARLHHIAGPLTPEIIRSRHASQWVDFTCGEVAAVVARLSAIAHRHGLTFSMYSAYESAHTHRRYNVDWHKLGPHLDRVYCGYSTDPALIEATQKAIGDTPLIGGLLLMGDAAQSRSTADILQTIFDNGGGVLCWYESRLDARALEPIARASRLVAAYETFITHGKRLDAAMITRLHLPDGAVAYRLQDQILLVLLNHQAAPKTIQLDLPAGTSMSSEFYTHESYKIAQSVTVPGGQVKAFVLRNRSGFGDPSIR